MSKIVVDYTAMCPGCGGDAWWRAERKDKNVHYQSLEVDAVSLYISCNTCGGFAV